MQSKLVLSFLSLIALAAGGLITGCDSDATIAKSGVGESCDSSADCNEGLKCLQGACYKSGSGTGGGGNEGGESTGTGATGATGPKPPVLGGEGESCTKRADCKEGLGCFNERCTKDAGGEGGDGNVPGVKLGQLGETCQTSADCDGALSCIPGGAGENAPYGYIGVCSRPRGTFTATGKTCGAECVEAADCCELPVAVHVEYALATPWGVGANSCADLEALLDGVNCATTTVAAAKARCFARDVYCDCADDAWSCDAGQCNYTGACTEDGPVPEGCPYYTRDGGITPTTTCNVDEGTCVPTQEQVAGCRKDADCVDEPIYDVPGETCVDGECACYKATGACYRRCDSSLDCRAAVYSGNVLVTPAQVCDDDTSVCMPGPECETNTQCVVRSGNTKAECRNEVCQITCSSDYECNEGYISGPNSLICGADGLCQPIGCSSDADCATGDVTPVRLFCTEVAATEATPMPSSAITD